MSQSAHQHWHAAVTSGPYLWVYLSSFYFFPAYTLESIHWQFYNDNSDPDHTQGYVSISSSPLSLTLAPPWQFRRWTKCRRAHLLVPAPLSIHITSAIIWVQSYMVLILSFCFYIVHATRTREYKRWRNYLCNFGRIRIDPVLLDFMGSLSTREQKLCQK